MFPKKSSIRLKPEKDGKINLYSRCIDSFKKFATINEEEISDVLKKF